jgi:beta-glucanase (GH16 family)
MYKVIRMQRRFSYYSLSSMTAVLLYGCGATTQPQTTSAAKPQWQLVWQDEFSGNQLDLTKWSFEVNCAGGGNNERQCYTNRPENATLAKGVLSITALKEHYSGPAAQDDSSQYDPKVTTERQFTSARLRSKGKGDWTYGRFEIRAKLPSGQGSWPAIWMLPTEWRYGGWASSGEIDIMEAVNLGTKTDDITALGQSEQRVHGTLHYGRQAPGNVYSGTSYKASQFKPTEQFHLYALEWEEGEIRWYIDDVHYATQTQQGWYSQSQSQAGVWQQASGAAPFDQPFHLVLNLAVGGNWPENVNEKGVDLTIWPQQMQVDYVRVYQCTASTPDGKGCGTKSAAAKLVPGYQPPVLPAG